MPHVTFVPMTGFRMREQQMRELGMSLPGLLPRASAIAELPALGVLTLAGVTPEPWTCSYRGTSEVSEQSIETILADQPDLVAISALTASIEEAYRLSLRLRTHRIPTVIGGLHASSCPEEAEMFCDSVIVGRGESVWAQVLQDVLAGTMQRRYVVPLNTMPLWPMPRFDLLPLTPARFTLQTQAGCPLACGFCGASRLLSRFAEKPIERIREELAVIRRLMPRPMIELADDNTFAGSRDVSPLLDAMQDARARWFTEADWRIGERPDILRRLASSGCQQVLMGIESLVFRYPGMGEKQAELNRIMNAVDAIQSAGVAVNGCFIIGADGETAQSLESLTEFLLNCSLAEIQVTLQTPFPGTSLYRQLQSEGRLLPERGWTSYTLFDVTYQPDCMTVEDLETGFRNVLRRVFSNSASQRRSQIRREIRRNARRFAKKAS